nr:TM2 domain-containing protein [Streptococcus sp. 19428wA2_WM07]
MNTLVDVFVSQGTGKRVNKWIYVTLAILLGSIGAHHFYTGDTRRGMWYLLLSWTMVPALFGFFQGLSAAFQPADELGMIIV